MPAFKKESTPPKDAPARETVTLYGTTDHPVKSISQLEGSPIITTFYQQILKEGDVPGSIDLILDPTQQQYRKINHAELMLQGDLAYAYDANQGITSVTGDIQIYPCMPVNAGDNYTARLSDGSLAIFVLSNVQPLTYLAKTAYSASVSFLTKLTQEYQDNFELKTVDIRYFDSRRKELTREPYANGNRDIDIGKLVRIFYDEYYDYATETALLTDENGEYVYDQYIVSFINRMLPREIRGPNPKLQMYNCTTEYSLKNHTSVLDLLMERTNYAIGTVVRQMRVVDNVEFSTMSQHYNIATSTIPRVVWPTNYKTLYSGAVEEDVAEPYYIMSKAFYDEDSVNYTDFDEVIAKYISGQDIFFADLIDPVNDLVNLDKKDRFYKLPIYILLAKTAI